MGVQNQASADTANTLFTAYAEDLFARVGESGVYDQICEIIDTDAEVNEIDILETMPALREWIGPKRFDSVRLSTFSVAMKSYEKSFEIPRRKLVGMTIPALEKRIQTWLNNFTMIYDKLAIALIVSNPTCYDGVALASASHPRGAAGATQSNITTSAFSVANHKAIVSAMQSLTDENGEPFEISPNLIVCGPKTLSSVLEVTKSTTRLAAVDNSGAESGTRVAAATIDNVFAGAELYGGGSMFVICSKRLIGTYDDYVLYLDTTKGCKPVIGFRKRAPEVTSMTDMTSPDRFKRDVYQWSVEVDIVFAPGAWQVLHFLLV
jgi:phage major head subunit gpT-like protein